MGKSKVKTDQSSKGKVKAGGSSKGKVSKTKHVFKWKEPCVLCEEVTQFDSIEKSYGCCTVCRFVEVRLKDIKKVIPFIKKELASFKKLKNTNERFQKEEKVVKDLEVAGTYAQYCN